MQAVGQVIKLNADGTITVKWTDNSTTTSYPQDLYIVDDVSLLFVACSHKYCLALARYQSQLSDKVCECDLVFDSSMMRILP